MYYKITNQKSEIYKTLKYFRQNELDINKRNRELVEKTIPYKWTKFSGRFGQQNFERVTTYSGFQFLEPEKVDLKVWKRDKDNSDYFTPNLRTKGGREMRDFLQGLEKSSFFKLKSLLGLSSVGRFSFPFLDICKDCLVLYLDDKWIPEDENFIEITSVEFEELRSVQ